MIEARNGNFGGKEMYFQVFCTIRLKNLYLYRYRSVSKNMMSFPKQCGQFTFFLSLCYGRGNKKTYHKPYNEKCCNLYCQSLTSLFYLKLIHKR